MEHPSAGAAAMLMHMDDGGRSALMYAAMNGDVALARAVLDQPSADAAAMLMWVDNNGDTALMLAAWKGHVAVARMLLDHPSADAAAMLMHTDNVGMTALMFAAVRGHVAVTRALLEHPSADAADMLMQANDDGMTALMLAAEEDEVDAARALLEHPSADAAAMLMHATDNGTTALEFAALYGHAPLLLFLLRRYDEVSPAARDGGIDSATNVLMAMCNGLWMMVLFAVNGPGDAVRDECIYRLLERGASVFVVPPACQPVVSRIIRELAFVKSVPRLINEAVVGLARGGPS